MVPPPKHHFQNLDENNNNNSNKNTQKRSLPFSGHGTALGLRLGWAVLCGVELFPCLPTFLPTDPYRNYELKNDLPYILGLGR